MNELRITNLLATELHRRNTESFSINNHQSEGSCLKKNSRIQEFKNSGATRRVAPTILIKMEVSNHAKQNNQNGYFDLSINSINDFHATVKLAPMVIRKALLVYHHHIFDVEKELSRKELRPLRQG